MKIIKLKITTWLTPIMMNKNGGDYEECFKPTPLQITGEESHLPCELEIEAENLVAFQVRDF